MIMLGGEIHSGDQLACETDSGMRREAVERMPGTADVGQLARQLVIDLIRLTLHLPPRRHPTVPSLSITPAFTVTVATQHNDIAGASVVDANMGTCAAIAVKLNACECERLIRGPTSG